MWMPDCNQVPPHEPAGADSSVGRPPLALASGLASPFEAATVVVVGRLTTLLTPERRGLGALRRRSLPSRAPMRLAVVWPELESVSVLALFVASLLVLLAVMPPGDLRGLVSDWWSGPPNLPAWEFRIGSTQQQVRAVQGAPTAVNGSVWRYGRSEVHFIGGRVAGWKTSPEHPLKVAPATPVRFAQDSSRP
jgi:hypothetical protein